MCIILDKRVKKTKAALRQALFLLLDKKKITEISVTELCRKANVNRRTFYIHYDKIEDIFEEYQSEIYLTIVQGLDVVAADVEYLLNTFDKILKQNFVGFRLLCLNEAHYPLVQKLETLLFKTLNENLNPHNEAQRQIVLTYVSAGLIKSYIHWFKSNGEISEKDLNQANGKAFNVLLKQI